MYKPFCLFCSFFLMASITGVFGQNSTVDSLVKALSEQKFENKTKVNLLNQLAITVYKEDSTKAYKYADDALNLAKLLDYKHGIAESLWVFGKTVAYHQSNLYALPYFQNAVRYSELSGNEGYAKYLSSLGNTYTTLGFVDSALVTYDRGFALASKLDDKIAMLRFIANRCIIYTGKGEFEQALQGYRHVLEDSHDLGEQNMESSALNNIGRVYQFLGIYPQSLYYYIRSLQIKELLKDTEGIANSYNNIGQVLGKQGDYVKAVEYLQKALKLAQELNDKRKIAESYENIAEIYLVTKNKQALDYLLKAWDIVNAVSSTTPKITVSIKLGDYYLACNELDKAMDYYNQAMDLSKQVTRERTISQIYLKMGIIYQHRKDFNKALDSYLQSLRIADQLNLLNEQMDCHKQLSGLYVVLNDFKLAYHHQKFFKDFNDSIYNEANVLQMAENEYTFRLEKEKQLHDIEQAKHDAVRHATQRQHFIIIGALVLAFVLVSIIAVFVFQSYRRKKRTNDLLVVQKNEIIMKNSQLQELIATKDKFFSIIAHDLRGGFNSILGFSDLIVQGGNQYSKKDLVLFADNIRTSAHQTQCLLENLLQWSRSNLGLIVFNPVVFSLRQFLETNIAAKVTHANEKDIDLQLTVDESIKIYADIDMLSVIVRNLMSNAIKFTPRGGKIVFNAEVDSRCVQILVKDNGIGMDIETKDNLFSVNRSVTRPGTEREPGTGLGLLICKEFVDRHQGEIIVESTLGNGSEFKVLIPAYGEA